MASTKARPGSTPGGQKKGFFADIGRWINKHPLGAAIIGIIAGVLVYFYFINPSGQQQQSGGVPGNFDDEIIILGQSLGNVGPVSTPNPTTGPTPSGTMDTGINPWAIPGSNLQLQDTPGGVITFGDTSLFTSTPHAPTGQSSMTRGPGKRINPARSRFNFPK